MVLINLDVLVASYLILLKVFFLYIFQSTTRVFWFS